MLMYMASHWHEYFFNTAQFGVIWQSYLINLYHNMLLGVGGLWLNLTEIVCMAEQYERFVGDKADRHETKYFYYDYEELWLVLE